MFKSDAERIIKRVMEETGAKFTEEQVQALSKMIPKIAALIVEEALSSHRPGSPGRGAFFGD